MMRTVDSTRLLECDEGRHACGLYSANDADSGSPAESDTTLDCERNLLTTEIWDTHMGREALDGNEPACHLTDTV